MLLRPTAGRPVLAPLAFAVALCGSATVTTAQVSPPAEAAPRGPFLRSRDLVTLGAFAAAAGALVPFDGRIARWSQRPNLQHSRVLRASEVVLRTLGNPGVLAIGGLTYGIGAAAGRRSTADVGLHTAGAIAVGSVATGVVKYAVGRARPFVTHDSDPTSVSLARGLQSEAYRSLPSGHATAAFAFAGALAAEGARRWPTTNRITGPAGYAVAGLVGLSRIYHDWHWASDVVLGAGIGATAGASIVRFAHAHPNNTLDRRLLPRAGAERALVSWTVPF